MLKGPKRFSFRKCIYLVEPVMLLRRPHGRASWNVKLGIGFDEWDLPKLSISVQDPGPSADELGEHLEGTMWATHDAGSRYVTTTEHVVFRFPNPEPGRNRCVVDLKKFTGQSDMDDSFCNIRTREYTGQVLFTVNDNVTDDGPASIHVGRGISRLKHVEKIT
ncbi:hypothetical protein QR685DRAFT_574597 [Neurospora intermedia]|uniref:Uncharacterized protein n=1 Tax=Neurospora intermedia TaxID=5142 RepID=A0ABR3D365_NEUIN